MRAITILFCLFIAGCGSEKFMNWLASTGDAFTEGVELGKKAKAIMFECDFDQDCTYEKTCYLLSEECQTPEKFDMVNFRECIAVFERRLTQAYWQNRQIMGYKEIEPYTEKELEKKREKCLNRG